MMTGVKGMTLNLHPGFILILGGIIAGALRGRLRQAAMLVFPLWALWSVINLEAGATRIYPFINNLELLYLKVDKLSWLMIFILVITTFLANVYALHVKKGGETASSLLYAGSSMGVVLAGDWLTLIFFWEMMAVTSTFMVWYGGTKNSLKAGYRYILVHFLGGNLLLAGILLKITAGQPNITVLTGTIDLSYWLILLGIAVNAAIPPLHAWLTDAYPETSITGIVFMNAFTTKVAVYTLIRIFPGAQILLWMGLIMAIYGVIYAVLENNIRRLLSYHIISQLGIMITGVGIGTELALNGAAALTFCHIPYKSILLMSAGAVIKATGRTKLTDLGGLYKRMPLNLIFFYIGAFAISGLPLLNGFISKSMIASAATYAHLPVTELLLYVANVGTFLSIALKLGYFMFFGADKGLEPSKVPVHMYLAMAGMSAICIIYGLFPGLLYAKLPYPTDYVPYTLDHVVSNVQLMLGAFVAFWILSPSLKTKLSLSLDTDWVYRKPVAYLIGGTSGFVCKVRDEFGVKGSALLAAILPAFANPLKWVPLENGEPAPARFNENLYRFPLGLTVFLCIVVFFVTVSYIWLV